MTVALSGNGVSGAGGGYARPTSNPTSLSFGTVTLGTSGGLPTIITNTGTASTTVSRYAATGAGFSGISLTGSGGAAVGQWSASPTTLNFGTVILGTSQTLPLSVSNTRTGSLTASQLNISGSGLSMTGMVLPLALSAGEGTSFNVILRPRLADHSRLPLAE